VYGIVSSGFCLLLPIMAELFRATTSLTEEATFYTITKVDRATVGGREYAATKMSTRELARTGDASKAGPGVFIIMLVIWTWTLSGVQFLNSRQLLKKLMISTMRIM
jgi:hypothetical protein